MEKIEVKVGQIWEGNDPRSAKRLLKVLEIKDGKAVVQHPRGIGMKTKIKLSRFKPTSTGYKLVQDVPGEAAKEESDVSGESEFKTHC